MIGLVHGQALPNVGCEIAGPTLKRSTSPVITSVSVQIPLEKHYSPSLFQFRQRAQLSVEVVFTLYGVRKSQASHLIIGIE